MVERWFERLIYASRWLLAPVYLGMGIALLALTVKFFHELADLLPRLFSIGQEELVLFTLGLIDLALVGSLVVMVMLSGYENAVSRLELDEQTEKLSWLGKLDSSSLKNKVSASIVAISSIHLLKVFMEARHIANDKIQWYIILHLTFVFSALIMTWMDRLQRESAKTKGQLDHPGH